MAISRAFSLAFLFTTLVYADDAYRTAVEPFLSRNCVACHNEKLKTANLNLRQPVDSPALWRNVLDKLTTGRMPPPGFPRPAQAELTAALAWIEPHAARTSAAPARVTLHRLNRAEYNNTVHDLLGVSVHPADEFPLDDAGYGFDNIGDVLSVSPLLMEKYMTAARNVSAVAVYGEPTPSKPTKLIRFMTRKAQDDPTPSALPYSYRGAIYGSFDFPVEGEYELRMRVANYRPRDKTSPRVKELSRKRNLTEAEKQELAEQNRQAYPAVKMVMTLDGAQVLTEVVEGNIDYQYAHGESVARVKVKAGEHSFRASFPEFAGMANPRDNVNLDGRRMLFIDYVDIVGPFSPVPARNGKVFVCAEQTSECRRAIVSQLARRAYRRPVSGAELDKLLKIASLGESFDEGIRLAVQAMLVSPAFLFRLEREPAGQSQYALDDYGLASRLSYFLWSTLPDAELMLLADQGRLRETGVLAAQVGRMLRDPKSDALVQNFAGQWLGLRVLDRRKPDPKHFDVVDDELIDAMRRETLLFAGAVLRENRPVLDFIDGRFTFVNGLLARHYGIPGIRGEAFERVDLDGDRRGGVLTQASVLTLSSYATRTSPVLRGKWVLENVLGTPPPPPPPDVPALKEANLGTDASVRQRLEQHRANPSCAVCHNQMDPIGFSLENYDASGVWRDRDGRFPIDSDGGPAQLRQKLRSQADLFTRNLVDKMLTYALGRGLEPSDTAAVEQIMSRLKQDGYRSGTLIQEIVNSAPFQMRKDGIQGGNVAHR